MGKVAQAADRILDIAMDPEVQWWLVRTLMVVPFWLFVFGRHCGPAEKHEAFELGYGLCPFHLLNFVRCPEKKIHFSGYGRPYGWRNRVAE